MTVGTDGNRGQFGYRKCEKRQAPVATRDLESLISEGLDVPVYGPNLRASCRRLEAAGLLRTLRAANMQLAVELTESGRNVALSHLASEREAEAARQRAAQVYILPLVGKELKDSTCLPDKLCPVHVNGR